MSTLKSFGIGINLSHFFNDHRHRARIFINDNIETVEDLQNRIASIFKISNFYITNTLNEYLPPCEDVRIVKNDDNIWVMPNKNIQLTFEAAPANEKKKNKNSLIRKRRCDDEISDLEQQVSASKKKKSNGIPGIDGPDEKSGGSNKKKKRRRSPSDIVLFEELEKQGKKKAIKKNVDVESEDNIDCLKKSRKKFNGIQECSEEEKVTDNTAKIELMPVSQSQLNICSEKNDCNSAKINSSVSKRNGEENICKGDLPNYKKKTNIPTTTDNYLKNKNINIVRIDVIKSPNNIQNIATDPELVNNELKHQNNMEITSSISQADQQLTSDTLKGKSTEVLSSELVETPINKKSGLEKQENSSGVEICPVQKSFEPPEIKLINNTTSTIDVETSHDDLSISRNDLENNIKDKSKVSINDTNVLCSPREQNQLSLSMNWESMSATHSDSSGEVLHQSTSTQPSGLRWLSGGSSYLDSKQIFHKDLALKRTSNSVATVPISRGESFDNSNAGNTAILPESDNTTSFMSVDNFNGDSYNNPITFRRRKRYRKRKTKKNSVLDDSTSPQMVMKEPPPPIFKPMNVKAQPSMHLKFIDGPDDDSTTVVPVEVGSTSNLQKHEHNTDIKDVIVECDTKDFVISEANILKSPIMVNLLPKYGDVISFKILKLNYDYTPEISSYITAKVTNFNMEDQLATMEIISGLDQCEEPIGKLTVEESERNTDQISVREFHWGNLISPRLLFP